MTNKIQNLLNEMEGFSGNGLYVFIETEGNEAYIIVRKGEERKEIEFTLTEENENGVAFLLEMEINKIEREMM